MRVWSLGFLLTLIGIAHAQLHSYGWQELAKPKTGYVLDKAHILSQDCIDKINSESAKCVSSAGVPVMVVTIPSIEEIQAYGSVDFVARHLFDDWAIGSARNNRAALLLISKGDRNARIELGADWGHDKDSASQTIMDNWIVPRFKEDDYNRGTLAGVQKLVGMITTGKVPVAPQEWWLWPLLGSFSAFGGWVIYDLIRFWKKGKVYKFFASSGGSGRYYGDGGGGGSSGGGFSGGGGASGSW